jgi:hypothetical protein
MAAASLLRSTFGLAEVVTSRCAANARWGGTCGGWRPLVKPPLGDGGFHVCPGKGDAGMAFDPDTEPWANSSNQSTVPIHRPWLRVALLTRAESPEPRHQGPTLPAEGEARSLVEPLRAGHRRCLPNRATWTILRRLTSLENPPRVSARGVLVSEGQGARGHALNPRHGTVF